MRRSRSVGLAVAVLLLAGLGALIWWRVGPLGGPDADAAVAAAESQARQVAIDSVTYDYRDINKSFGTLQNELTGDALTDFGKNKTGIQQTYTNLKLVTAGAANASGVVPGASAEHATILVAVSVAQSVNGGNATRMQLLFSVGMVHENGRWVAESLSEQGNG